MLSLALILALCCVTPGNSLPSKDASVVPADQSQAFLNNPANQRSTVPILSEINSKENNPIQAAITEPRSANEVVRRSLITIVIDFIAWPWRSGLHLYSACDPNSWGRWIRVSQDTCYRITDTSLKIKKLPICPDGTIGKLAVYNDEGCSSMLLNAQLEDKMVDWCLEGSFRYAFFRGALGKKMKSLKVLCSASPEYDKSLARNATVKLFTASTKSQEPEREDRCTGVFNTVSIPADTCLSGDYYPTNNIQTVKQPLCADGQVPVYIEYKVRGCTGEVGYSSGGMGPSVCISSWIQPRYWSIIWRCKYIYGYPDGASDHQVAVPPPAPFPDPPRSAVVIPYSTPDCTSGSTDGLATIEIRVGECLATPVHGIRILEPAVCENGTRAQWARYVDERCDRSSFWGIKPPVDIANDDVGKCHSLGPLNTEVLVIPIIRSMAFWCDGLQPGKMTYSIPTLNQQDDWSRSHSLAEIGV